MLNSEFKDTIDTLLKEGWFDWQMLCAVKILILGYRNNMISQLNLSVQQMFEELKRQSIEFESQDDIEVPLELFSLKELRNMLILAKKELKKRYKFDKMDVKHDDFFDLERIANL